MITQETFLAIFKAERRKERGEGEKGGERGGERRGERGERERTTVGRQIIVALL